MLAHCHHLDDVCLEGLLHNLHVDVGVLHAYLLHARVVDEHVDPAVDLHVLFNSLLTAAVVAKVECDAVTLATSLLDLLQGPVCILLLFGEVADGDVCTLSGHQNGDGASNARVTAGDQDGLVLEQVSALIFLKVWLLILVPELELRPVGGRVELAV